MIGICWFGNVVYHETCPLHASEKRKPGNKLIFYYKHRMIFSWSCLISVFGDNKKEEIKAADLLLLTSLKDEDHGKKVF